jgi:hypothetical protein
MPRDIQLNRLPATPEQPHHYYDVLTGKIYDRATVESWRGLERDEEGKILHTEEWTMGRIKLLQQKREDTLNRLGNIDAELRSLGVVAEAEEAPAPTVIAEVPLPLPKPVLTGWRGWLAGVLRSILETLEGHNG